MKNQVKRKMDEMVFKKRRLRETSNSDLSSSDDEHFDLPCYGKKLNDFVEDDLELDIDEGIHSFDCKIHESSSVKNNNSDNDEESCIIKVKVDDCINKTIDILLPLERGKRVKIQWVIDTMNELYSREQHMVVRFGGLKADGMSLDPDDFVDDIVRRSGSIFTAEVLSRIPHSPSVAFSREFSLLLKEGQNQKKKDGVFQMKQMKNLKYEWIMTQLDAQNLTLLDFQNCFLGGNSFIPLCKALLNTSLKSPLELKSLCLKKNLLTFSDLLTLVNMVPCLQSLKFLDLSSNNISFLEKEKEILLPWLGNSLEELSLRHNPLQCDLGFGCDAENSLSSSNSSNRSNSFAKKLFRNCPKLKNLDLRYCRLHGILGSGVKTSVLSNSIRKLQVSGNHDLSVCSNLAGVVGMYPNLQELSLKNCSCSKFMDRSDDQFASINRNGLNSVVVNGMCLKVYLPSFFGNLFCGAMQVLDISSTHIDSGTFSLLVSMLLENARQLRVFLLNENIDLESTGAFSLCRLVKENLSICTIEAENCSFGISGLNAIINTLRSLDFSSCLNCLCLSRNIDVAEGNENKLLSFCDKTISVNY